MPKLKIIVIDEDGNEEDITERMYWFEENGIQDINDLDFYGHKYRIKIYIGDKLVYQT